MNFIEGMFETINFRDMDKCKEMLGRFEKIWEMFPNNFMTLNIWTQK